MKFLGNIKKTLVIACCAAGLGMSASALASSITLSVDNRADIDLMGYGFLDESGRHGVAAWNDSYTKHVPQGDECLIGVRSVWHGDLPCGVRTVKGDKSFELVVYERDGDYQCKIRDLD